jgi:hypothetical protein
MLTELDLAVRPFLDAIYVVEHSSNVSYHLRRLVRSEVLQPNRGIANLGLE